MTALHLPAPLTAEDAAAVLAKDDSYRVLRQFVPCTVYDLEEPPGDVRVGVFVDCETTGLDPERDKIIELALLPFLYDRTTGRVRRALTFYVGFEDPGEPLSPEVQKLTGLEEHQLAGQRFDAERVLSVLDGADLIVAHFAQFDRKFCEKRFAAFASKHWACSCRDVDWRSFGVEGAKLCHVLEATCGEFVDGHRALVDCQVGVHVLATAQVDGKTALAHVLESARQPTYRIIARGFPRKLNGALKARRTASGEKYRWDPRIRADGTAGKESWYVDTRGAERDAETAWLHEHGVTPRVQRYTAMDRYSARVA